MEFQINLREFYKRGWTRCFAERPIQNACNRNSYCCVSSTGNLSNIWNFYALVQWIKNHHPSTDGKAVAKIVKIEIAGDESVISEWLGSEVKVAIGSGIEVEWVSTDTNDGDTGIVAVEVETASGKVRLD